MWLTPIFFSVGLAWPLQHSADIGQTQCDWLYSGSSPKRIHITTPLACVLAALQVVSKGIASQTQRHNGIDRSSNSTFHIATDDFRP